MYEEMKKLYGDVVNNGTRFILVTGGVCSSIGKGVLISSLGTLLQNAGYKLSVIKCDPYLNVDPGTMSPLEHGEVFVTRDGAETDLDLGHYERTLGVELSKDSSITAGKVFSTLLQGERKGDYLGKCITVVPHVTNEIQKRIITFSQDKAVDVVLIEIGGTVGDIEAEIFLEAVRQLRAQIPHDQFAHCHLSFVPYLSWADETKTKPTQHSVMRLKQYGLTPDMLFLRTEKEIEDRERDKVAIMCGIAKDAVFQVLTHKPVYKLFFDLAGQRAHELLQKKLGFPYHRDTDLSDWLTVIEKIEASAGKTVTIGLIAKYFGSNDPYMSLVKALKSAGFSHGVTVDLKVINTDDIEESGVNLDQVFAGLDGIVVPGGFGSRGVEGKIAATKWAREKQMPFFGICLGMQMMLVEAARSLLGKEKAASSEIDPETPDPIITMMDGQQQVVSKGGTMRLGSYPCQLKKGSRAHTYYGADHVEERHRHRYEFNSAYQADLEAQGVIFSGVCPDNSLVEIVELKDHPFMMGVQFHPEYCSSPRKPHPLIGAFVGAVVEQKGEV